MFRESAPVYDAIYSAQGKDYAAEADRVQQVVAAAHPEARTLLDVACGTGRHLEFLSEHFDCEGVDINDDFLAIARERCPEARFTRGDMTGFDLARRFDVVTCLFSSVAYAHPRVRLYEAIRSMARHVAAGGLLVVEPFFRPDEFMVEGVWAVFVDEPDLKVARIGTNRQHDDLAVLDFHYLVGHPGDVTSFTERHELGLYDWDDLTAAFEREGLEVEIDEEGLIGRGLVIGRAAG